MLHFWKLVLLNNFKLIIYVKTLPQLLLISIIINYLCLKKKKRRKEKKKNPDFEFDTSFLVTIDLFLLAVHIVILTATSRRVYDTLPSFT